MLRSLDLRKEPSVRQSETILRRIDEELTARGARVHRAGPIGGLRFRMPQPWDAPRLGILLAITSGRAVVSAGSGGPWRVRYELNFSVLRWTTIGLTAILVILVLSGYLPWDRLTLLNAILVLWVVVYGIPYLAASIRFERIIRRSAAEILERRHQRRTEPSPTPPPKDSPEKEVENISTPDSDPGPEQAPTRDGAP